MTTVFGMPALFKCDSFWCCWAELLYDIGHGLWLVRWPLIAYGVAYAIGAAIFLITLRIKSKDGELHVPPTSWAYKIAHPMYYGGHFPDTRAKTNICAIYARMFNMLLFVWPFLLLWFAIATVVGSIVLFLVVSSVVHPNLRFDAFMRRRKLITIGKGESKVAFPMVIPVFVIVMIFLVIKKIVWLLAALKMLAWGALCLLPVLLVIGIVSLLIVKWRSKKPNSVNGAAELLSSKKGRFCKMVQLGNHEDNETDETEVFSESIRGD